MLNLIININSLELFSIDGIILLQVKVSHRRSCQPDLLLFMIKEHILHRSVDTMSNEQKKIEHLCLV
jgi:hypothetical protein